MSAIWRATWRAIWLATLIGLLPAGASLAAEGGLPPRAGYTLRVDWQLPEMLPPRYRNHCTFENFTGRPYCSDHCGVDYQFYFCSELSFGCCHLGHGYCDFNGFLRCHP